MYGTSKVLLIEKEKIKYNNTMKRYKSDSLWWCYKRKHKRTHIKGNMKEYNPKWSEAPVHPYRIVIIGSSGLGKSNSLFN